MPEEGWDNQYENHDIIRLDCSRFICFAASYRMHCMYRYASRARLAWHVLRWNWHAETIIMTIEGRT